MNLHLPYEAPRILKFFLVGIHMILLFHKNLILVLYLTKELLA